MCPADDLVTGLISVRSVVVCVVTSMRRSRPPPARWNVKVSVINYVNVLVAVCCSRLLAIPEQVKTTHSECSVTNSLFG